MPLVPVVLVSAHLYAQGLHVSEKAWYTVIGRESKQRTAWIGGGKGRRKMRVVERVAGYYAVEEVEDFGKVYRWRPESIVVDCGCGRRTTLKRSDVIGSKPCCECGAVPTGKIREEVILEVLDENSETGDRPWRYWHTSEHTGLPI